MGMTEKIIGVVIAVVVFSALVGTIITQVDASGLNGSGLVLAGLFPLFLVIGLVAYIVKASSGKK